MEIQDTAAAAAQSMIDSIQDLPTPPLVLTQIIKLINDPDASAEDVALILAEDSAMAAKVLKISNSAHYELSSTVTSVENAIEIIGRNSVKSLITSMSIIELFKGNRVNPDFQDGFWRHSLVTAFGSRVLMREMQPNDSGAGELAFSTGLLHDIGKMVMYLHSPEHVQQVLEKVAVADADELELERELFGFDHAVMGGMLTEKWNMPKELCRAIAHHHQPLSIDDPLRLTDAIHVADGLAYHALASGDEMLTAPPIDPGVFERNDLKLEELGDYLAKLKGEYVQAGTLLKIALGDV